MKDATYHIVGTKPILLHDAQAFIQPTGGAGPRKKSDPKAEAEAGTRRNDAGEIIFPAMAFRSALLSACIGQKFGKLGAKGVVQGAVFTKDEWVNLCDIKGKPYKTYTIDSRKGTNPNNKAAIIINRARLDVWTCMLRMEVDTDFLALDALDALITRSGRMCGVGAFRIAKAGQFGAFTATRE